MTWASLALTLPDIYLRKLVTSAKFLGKLVTSGFACPPVMDYIVFLDNVWCSGTDEWMQTQYSMITPLPRVPVATALPLKVSFITSTVATSEHATRPVRKRSGSMSLQSDAPPKRLKLGPLKGWGVERDGIKMRAIEYAQKHWNEFQEEYPEMMKSNSDILCEEKESVLCVVISIANAQRPTQKLQRTKRAINACKELLEGAKLTCARDHVELTDRTRRISEVAVSASRIQVQLMEKHHDFTTWKGCVEYVNGMCNIWKKIHQCAKDVREIETSNLRTIEAENQRQSGENIRDCDEICDALGSQASARQRRRRLGQALGTGNTTVSYEALASAVCSAEKINRNSSLETAFPAQSACFASCSIESNPRNSPSHWKESERSIAPLRLVFSMQSGDIGAVDFAQKCGARELMNQGWLYWMNSRDELCKLEGQVDCHQYTIETSCLIFADLPKLKKNYVCRMLPLIVRIWPALLETKSLYLTLFKTTHTCLADFPEILDEHLRPYLAFTLGEGRGISVVVEPSLAIEQPEPRSGTCCVESDGALSATVDVAGDTVQGGIN
ncbi:hypothetical protein B0H14DRAFT_2583216 [Mycena olivaceomarginata]|nr:hypothetical protein B0H14DRAFT_2583216 [Mycena olivaceomarginata]